MNHEPERPDPAPRAGDGPASAPPLADASTAADNPAENTPRGGGRKEETLSRPQPTGVPLELVSEEGDKTLDLKAVHDAVAILLVRYHRKVGSEKVTGGMA